MFWRWTDDETGLKGALDGSYGNKEHLYRLAVFTVIDLNTVSK